MMNNRQLAETFTMIADLSEIKGENIYKTLAYRKAADSLLNLGREASRLRGVVNEAVDESLVNARRAARRGYNSAEDLLEETAHEIKRHPFRSVACALVMGALAGWLLFPRRKG